MYNELRTLYVEYIYFVCIWYWVPHIGTMNYAYCIQLGNAEREGSAILYNAKKDLHCGILCKLYAVMTDKLVDSVYRKKTHLILRFLTNWTISILSMRTKSPSPTLVCSAMDAAYFSHTDTHDPPR